MIISAHYLVGRLDLHDCGAVDAPRPHGGGRCGIVGEKAAHVGIEQPPRVQNPSQHGAPGII